MPQQEKIGYNEFVELIDIPPPASNRASCFAFSLHKAGSTLLFNMLGELSRSAHLTYFSLEDRRFALGYEADQLAADIVRIFQPHGYMYGGFRHLKSYSTPLMRDSSKILLVRNPMDILTSSYFSVSSSHISPGDHGGFLNKFRKNRTRAREQSIDEFVTHRSQALFASYMSYLNLLSDPNMAIYRYEDVVYDKVRFLTEICNHYQWSIPERRIREIAARHDRIPTTELPDQHIRQVHPGNHRKHLSTATIDALNAEFDPILKAFGYRSSGILASSVLRNFAESGSERL